MGYLLVTNLVSDWFLMGYSPFLSLLKQQTAHRCVAAPRSRPTAKLVVPAWAVTAVFLVIIDGY